MVAFGMKLSSPPLFDKQVLQPSQIPFLSIQFSSAFAFFSSVHYALEWNDLLLWNDLLSQTKLCFHTP